MADLTYYAAKIAECLRLLESSNDPLYRNVYQAMADEFAEKYATLSRRAANAAAGAVPPTPLLIETGAITARRAARRERGPAAHKPLMGSDVGPAPAEALSPEPESPALVMRRP